VSKIGSLGRGETYGTFSFTSVCSKTRPPPTPGVPILEARSMTPNGFIALMPSASARCAVSSAPVDFTNTNSTVRPHVS